MAKSFPRWNSFDDSIGAGRLAHDPGVITSNARDTELSCATNYIEIASNARDKGPSDAKVQHAGYVDKGTQYMQLTLLNHPLTNVFTRNH